MSTSAWQQKVVIVTGASSGFGRSLAEAFAGAAARVVLAARGVEALERTASQMGARGHDAFAIPTDVTCDAAAVRLVEQTVEKFGRLDALVNAAGRSVRGRLLDVTPADYAELLDMNFLSVVRCTRAAVPHLLKTRGSVVNIGSLASKSAGRYVGGYPVSKFAVAAYSQQLRLELSDEGLHVLLVCPGPLRREDASERYAQQAAGLPDSARRPGAGVKTKLIDPDRLAAEVVQACERRHCELIRPRKARLLFTLGMASPRLGDWLIRRFT